MLEPVMTPEQIKFKLVQIIDELLLLKNQKAWEELATKDLNELLVEATDKAEMLWWVYRNTISGGVE
ncbi:MAG: hypothetical protein KME28_27490 [Pelatocladus maniniholoensis HA4357-MV3]|jgi:hypothetical protein|uniref:Uncharacterized protein n=1 Tax=Pelatocladus maniniholoensis HA4357-MV3 TaxID=1117104 RepID=A0A9E3HF98_9NOST|nr:hypothetical protein [Pelatocladus maniniholoensis HA4357-MV3]